MLLPYGEFFIGWPPVLVLQEITSRPAISVTSYQSKANPNYPPFIAALARGGVTYGEVEAVKVPDTVQLPGRETMPRAILRVELVGGFVIYALHLNSSGLGLCRLEDARRLAGS